VPTASCRCSIVLRVVQSVTGRARKSGAVRQRDLMPPNRKAHSSTTAEVCVCEQTRPEGRTLSLTVAGKGVTSRGLRRKASAIRRAHANDVDELRRNHRNRHCSECLPAIRDLPPPP